MTFFLHKAGGLLTSNQPWSTGLITSASVSEGAANTAWTSAWTALFATAAFNDLYRTSVTVTATSTSTASAVFKQTTITRANVALAGTATTQELPDYCALVLTLRSATATKYGHGRMFLPAPVAAALGGGTGGHLGSANVTAIAAAMSTFFTSLVTAGLSPVLVTKKANVSQVPLYSTRAVVAADMPNVLTVQHRRGDKIVPVRTTITL